MGWWARLVGWLRSWFAPAGELTAADAIAELRRSKGATGDPAAFRHLRNRLATLVLSPADRARLWRRARGLEPGEIVALDAISRPTDRDVRALRQLVEELERGR